MPSIHPAALALVAAFAVPTLQAQTVPSAFTVDTLLQSGLTAPNDFCFLPDGRVLIASRDGTVQLYVGTTTTTPVGTVPNVETGSERGLLSIEPDPNFPTNGQIYVWYSSSLDNFMHLDRFECTGDLANPASTNLAFAAASRRVILAAIPDVNFNHNGGAVRFGPDGMLYVTIGDDAVSCNAQNTSSASGCLLRMNVAVLPAGGSASAPSFATIDPGNNPLSANNDISQLVIAYGLRNPFRNNIDPVTGNIYIGDVGQSAVEEYSEYVYPTTGPLPLVNFGWPWREGPNTYTTCGGAMPAVVGPISYVNQGSGWQSVMGGPRYRNMGQQFDFGSGFEGIAFFHDYFSGQMRALVESGGTWSTLPPVQGQPGTWFATGFVGVPSVREGPDGALYYVQHPSTYATSGGTFERVRPLGPVNSVAVVSGSGQRATIGETFGAPCVARVFDPQNQPLGGAQVNFAVSGGATLSTTNPVIADANGYAQTTVTATSAGGGITVTATTPGAVTSGTFALFARKLAVIRAGNLTVLTISNQTAAVPASVPLIVMAGFPGVPSWASPFGNVCTDPTSYLTVVIEDGSGVFGGVSLSGTGGTGNPGLTKLYNLAPGLLNGLLLKFTAVGIDSVDGVFVTNCATQQF
ncbi:MAG: PQQ-dependent sugar dehydrogenase [Planctomycetota bacterium]